MADATERTTTGDQDSRVVKLKGLPYHVSKQEIVEFFGDLEVIFVHFVFETDGRPSGLAFAEFKNRAVAAKALKKRGHYLHKRYIKILQVGYDEMREQVLLGTAAIPTSRYQPWSAGAFPPNSHTTGQGVPGGLAPPGLRTGGFGRPPPNPNMLRAPASLSAPQNSMRLPPPPPLMAPRPQPPPTLPNGGGSGNGMQLIVNFEGDVVTTSTSSFRRLLACGSAVYISGLNSHTATIVQDITQLFCTFRLDLPSMVYGVDLAGAPSGEVWLRFRSCQDAYQCAPPPPSRAPSSLPGVAVMGHVQGMRARCLMCADVLTGPHLVHGIHHANESRVLSWGVKGLQCTQRPRLQGYTHISCDDHA